MGFLPNSLTPGDCHADEFAKVSADYNFLATSQFLTLGAHGGVVCIHVPLIPNPVNVIVLIQIFTTNQ